MTDEPGAVEETSANKEFSRVRKGYDPAQVDGYLAEYDVAFRELEEYAARLKRELSDARSEISRLEMVEKESVDRAMMAVFDAKERIMERAMVKAREIEDEARAAAGLPPSTDDLELPESSHAESVEMLTDGAAVAGFAGDTLPGGSQQDDVLQRMLQEAETIRARLDDGLAAAFGHMEKIQRDAELRATDLLDEARLEAARLRDSARASTGVESATEDGASVEADLPIEGSRESGRRRPSRYSRNSAGLPRIGDDDGHSVLATMDGLRTKMREGDETPSQDENVPEPHDVAG